MTKFVGRAIEREKIHAALTSSDPELVAVWGRRRVGKTFLIRYGREPVTDHHGNYRTAQWRAKESAQTLQGWPVGGISSGHRIEYPYYVGRRIPTSREFPWGNPCGRKADHAFF